MGKGFSDYYTNREKALDLKKSAVLIVDMMNDFCKPGGRMVLEDGYLIVEPIQRLSPPPARTRSPSCGSARNTGWTNTTR